MKRYLHHRREEDILKKKRKDIPAIKSVENMPIAYIWMKDV